MSFLFSRSNLQYSNSFSVYYFFFSLSLFEKFLTQRLFLTELPVDISFLEKFLKPISKISMFQSVEKLIKKKIINFYSSKYCFFLDLSFKKAFCKYFYQKRKKFTNLKKNLFSKNFPFLERKSKQNLPFFNIEKNVDNFKTSFQAFQILKNFRFLENDWENENFKADRFCLKFLFKNQEEHFLRFFQKLDSGQKKFYKHLVHLPPGSFFRFKGGIFSLKSKRNFISYKKWKKRIYSVDFYRRLKQEPNIKRKMFHFFFSNNLHNFPFFHELGVCFFPRFSDKIFFFETLKKNSGKIFSGEKNLQIVVESNYRIYVYKKKSYPYSIFELFSEPFYHVEKFYVGEITEKSISKALKKGLTSLEILDFLKKNLHEICLKIPKTVTNQIKIWEFGIKKNFFYNSTIFFKKRKDFERNPKSLNKFFKKNRFQRIRTPLILSQY